MTTIRFKTGFVATFALLSCAPGLAAGVGGWDTGGGMAVVYGKRDVRFADFVSPSELPKAPASDNQVIDAFYAKNREVRALADIEARSKLDFWKRAIPVLRASVGHFPVLERLISELEIGSNVILLEQRIHYSEGNWRKFESPSLPRDYQEPVAAYVEGEVVISKRIVSAMPKDHVTGLAVHESLRQLNFLNLLRSPLTTSEIEALTRHFMGRQRRGDSIASAAAKLSRPKPTKAERFAAKEARINAEKAAIDAALEHQVPGSSEWNALRAKWYRLNSESIATNTAAVGALLDDSEASLKSLKSTTTMAVLGALLPRFGLKFDVQAAGEMDLFEFLAAVKKTEGRILSRYQR